MWGLQLFSSMGQSFATKSFSDEMFITREFDYSEHETYYLRSRHLDEITPNQSDIAYYRSKALLRIFNGCLMLTGDSKFQFSDEVRFFEVNGDSRSAAYRKSDFTIIEYEELLDPFANKNSIQLKAERSFFRDCIILAKEDPVVRQSIICLSLSSLDALYFLTNIYKIYENIFHDLGIPKNVKDQDYKKFALNNTEFSKYTDFFLKEFKHYANSEKGAGILSRHGNTGKKDNYNKGKVDFNEIDYNARQLMNYWLRFKMKERFGHFYAIEYKGHIIEEMRDEDYDF